MKNKKNRFIQYAASVIFLIIISYCIASVLILGEIRTPVFIHNSNFFCKSYSLEQIKERSDYLDFLEYDDIVSATNPKFRTQVDSFSRIHLPYGKKGNRDGYLFMDIGVLSEENIDVRVCVFEGQKEPVTFVKKVNEGNNLFKIPLENGIEIRIDFLTSVPVDFVLNDLKVSNQLVGILPASWYWCFLFCFLIGLEFIFCCFKKNIKLQKVLYGRSVQGIYILEKGIKKAICFIKSHKWAFLLCFCICIFTYAYNLMNFSLGVDEERDIVRSLGTIENVKELLLREGRFGLYLFRRLETLDGSFTVFVEEILSVIFIFGNIVVLAKCLEVVSSQKLRDSAIVVFGGMLATLPFINAEIMCYSIMNAGVYYSVMITSMALLLVSLYLSNQKRWYLFSALLLTVVALFFTEANNAWFIVGTVFINLVWVIANSTVTWKEWIKNVLHYAGLYIVSFLIYMSIRSIIGESGYVSGYIHWQDGKPIELLRDVFVWIGTLMINKSLPGAIYMSVGILIFSGFILVSVLGQKWSRACLVLFLAICLFITPFSLCFVAGSRMPYRTLEALLLLEAGVWFVVINFIDKNLIARYILLIIAFCVIWKQCVWMNRIFYGADLSAKLDMEMGYSIGEEIERTVGSKQVLKPIVFVGEYQHSSPNIYKIDAVGQSVFNRAPSRYKVYYLRHLGFEFQQADKQQIDKAQQLAQDMNVWPLAGSIKEFDDFIVVKLK